MTEDELEKNFGPALMVAPGDYLTPGGTLTFARLKTFPSHISVGDARVVLHADGRITGATAAEWADALAKMEGSGVGGVQVTVWLILRELQRQEAA